MVVAAKRIPAFSVASWSMVLGFALLLSFIDSQGLVGINLPWGRSFSSAFLIGERVLEAATFVAVGLGSAKSADLAHRRGLVWGIAAACSVLALFELFIFAARPEGATVALKLLHGILRGTGPCVFWLVWIELYSFTPIRHVLVNYLAAYVVSALMTVIINLAGVSVVTLLVLALMPPGSALLLLKAGRDVDSKTFLPEETAPTTQPSIVPPVVLMAVFTLANVFARDLLPAADRLWATVGVVACLVVLLLVLRGGHMRFGLMPLCGAAFPLTLAGLFGLLLKGEIWGVAATLCTHAGQALFSVFIGVVLCNIAFRYGASCLRLFGLSQAAGSLSALVGALLAFDMNLQGDALTLAVAGMALALCLCYVVLTRRQTDEIVWGMDPAQDERTGEDGAGAETVLSASEQAERLESVCSLIAYECGLTRREEEVLALLAQDFSAQQIEESLVVSNATAKSHTHSVYQKLGVHSRPELIKFVADFG